MNQLETLVEIYSPDKLRSRRVGVGGWEGVVTWTLVVRPLKKTYFFPYSDFILSKGNDLMTII